MLIFNANMVQMSALAVIGATQISESMVPLTASTGGTSTSDPGAGGDASHTPSEFSKLTTADRAGAGILTFLAIVFIIGLSIWIVL